MSVRPLQPTSWLAKRLGLSVSTVERLRSRGCDTLPPHIVIGGHSIRYDELVVEAWIEKRMRPDAEVAPPASAPATRPVRRIGNRLIAAAI